MHRTFNGEGTLFKLLEAFIPMLVGGVVFLIFAKLLKIREAEKISSLLSRKLGRN